MSRVFVALAAVSICQATTLHRFRHLYGSSRCFDLVGVYQLESEQLERGGDNKRWDRMGAGRSYVDSLRDNRSFIHFSTASSLYATRFVEIRIAFGNSQARSFRKSVVREKVVRFKTSALEINRMDHLSAIAKQQPFLAQQRMCAMLIR